MMRRLSLLLALLVAGPVGAQNSSGASSGDPALAPTADRFGQDLRGITHLAATAMLVFGETGRFPDSPFALLGSAQATQTGLRDFRLSSLTVEPAGDSLRMLVVPLPAPYVRDDRVIEMTVYADGDGAYHVRHEIRRFGDPDDGARPMLYDRSGGYEVERAFGTLCMDMTRARTMVAEGRFEPDPRQLCETPLTVRVVPPGQSAPTYYQTIESAQHP